MRQASGPSRVVFPPHPNGFEVPPDKSAFEFRRVWLVGKHGTKGCREARLVLELTLKRDNGNVMG